MRFAVLLLTFLAGMLLLAACTVAAPPPLLAPAPTPIPQPAVPPTPLASGVELVWRTQLGGVINWMPMLVTGADGREQLIVASEAGSAVALDPASGVVTWQYAPPGLLWSDSVAVLGDAVFVASEGATVTLLDGATGTVRWQRSIQPAQGATLAGLEARSKPVLADGIVYVPTAGVGSRATVINPAIDAPLLALDFATGSELWRFESDSYILRAPFVEVQTDTVYVGGNTLPQGDVDEGGALRIYALNLKDGSVRWTHDSLDGLIKSLWAGGEVLTFVAYRDFLIGLDSASGAELYRHNTGNWVQSFTVFPPRPAPSGLPSLAYGSANAFLNLVDPANGEFIWRYNVEGAFNYPIGNAVMDGDTITFISQRGDLHALAPEDGSLRWRYATGLETRDGIAVGAGHIFVGSVDGAVYGFALN